MTAREIVETAFGTSGTMPNALAWSYKRRVTGSNTVAALQANTPALPRDWLALGGASCLGRHAAPPLAGRSEP